MLSIVANNFLSQAFIDKVKVNLSDTGIEVLNGQKPIVEMSVLVSGAEGTVYIDELMGDVAFGVPGDAGAGGGAVAGRGVDDEGKAAGVPAGKDERRRLQGRQLNMQIFDNNRFENQHRNWFLQLQSGMMSLRRDQINMRNDMKTEISGVKQCMEQGFEIVNGNMKQYAMQASVAQRVRTTAGMEMLAIAAVGGEELAMGSGGAAAIGHALAITNPPTLMPQPKSLYDLWNEYLMGWVEKVCKASLRY